MTAAMKLMHRRLPWWERYPLPPSAIVRNIARRAGLSNHEGRDEHWAMTWAAHFAYGAVAGAVYAPAARPIPLPAGLKGNVFGLAVWAVSYLGWLPAMQILPSATERPPRRAALMIAAHVVWGYSRALYSDLLLRRKQRQGSQE
jgi:hypothetical protein